MNYDHFPLSIFADATQSLVGKLFLIFVTLCLGVVIGVGIFLGIEYLVYNNSVEIGIHWLVWIYLYPGMVIRGLSQFWGFPIYLAIFCIALFFLRGEMRIRWLFLLFALQTFETSRLFFSGYLQ